MVTKVLALADEALDIGYRGGFKDLHPDVVVACGDLPDDYLEAVVTTLSVPLVWVPGNHDRNSEPPGGATSADGRIVEAGGLVIAGLGGSPSYNRGPHQYTEAQMSRKARWLELRARLAALRGKSVDIVITHAPPRGLGDADDPAHRGFMSFRRVIKALRPRYFIHGHIHPYGPRPPDLEAGVTTIVNAVGYRLLEVTPT